MVLTCGCTNGRKCCYTDRPSDMNQHYAVRNPSVTSYSLDNLQLVIFRLVSTHTSSPGAPRHGVSSCTALLSSRYHQDIHVLTSHIRVFIVLPHYHQGTHCTIILPSSGYSYFVIVLPSSGYSLCYHPAIIRVLIVLSSYHHQGTHGAVDSTAKTSHIIVQNPNTRLQASASV